MPTATIGDILSRHFRTSSFSTTSEDLDDMQLDSDTNSVDKPYSSFVSRQVDNAKSRAWYRAIQANESVAESSSPQARSNGNFLFNGSLGDQTGAQRQAGNVNVEPNNTTSTASHNVSRVRFDVPDTVAEEECTDSPGPARAAHTQPQLSGNVLGSSISGVHVDLNGLTLETSHSPTAIPNGIEPALDYDKRPQVVSPPNRIGNGMPKGLTRCIALSDGDSRKQTTPANDGSKREGSDDSQNSASSILDDAKYFHMSCSSWIKDDRMVCIKMPQRSAKTQPLNYPTIEVHESVLQLGSVFVTSETPVKVPINYTKIHRLID